MDARTGQHATGPNDAGACARRMARLVDDQHALCTELDGLSRSQSTLVESGDTDGVLEVLGQRQQLIDRISHLNEELAPLREQRDTLMAFLGEPDRERVRRRVEEIALTVERIRARDDHDREEMERRRTVIAGELSGLARARGAVAAYSTGHPGGAGGGAHGPGPRFQDRKG